MAALLQSLRTICQSFPDVSERPSHGAPTWFVRSKTSFATAWLDGHHDIDYPHLWIAAAPGVAEVLVASRPDTFFRPPYVGPRGWLGVRLDREPDWDELADLLADAYRQVAPKRLVAQMTDPDAPKTQDDSIRVVPVSAERWPDVEAVFGTRGDPSWCFCQFFLTTGRSYEESADRNREALCAQVAQQPPPGLLAYEGPEPVGWVQVGPRASFPRITTNRTTASLDSDGVWRCTCFVVRVGHRRQGVARALLAGAIDYARNQGATQLEAHPVDVAAKGGKVPSPNLYHGALSMFADEGFVEVLRTRPDRPVVRLSLR